MKSSRSRAETPPRRRRAEEPASVRNGDADTGRQHKRSKRSLDSRATNPSRSTSPVHPRNSPSRHESRSRSTSPVPHKHRDPRAIIEKKRQLCSNYSRGSCSNGLSCVFVHDDRHGERHRRHRDQAVGEPDNGAASVDSLPRSGMDINFSSDQSTLIQAPVSLLSCEQEKQQHQDLMTAELGEPLMEAISPDMPASKHEEEQEDAKIPTAPEPEPEPEPRMDKDSPDIVVSGEEADADQEGRKAGHRSAKKKAKQSKSSVLVKLAVTEYVKRLLQPTWKEGKLSKDVYKTIAKKAVDKVVGTLQGDHIPSTQEKVDHFIEFSRQKISKLVQGYVDKYLKPA